MLGFLFLFCLVPLEAFTSDRGVFHRTSRLHLLSDILDDDDEFFPNDPAHTTPQLMAAIWDQIKHGASMAKGESFTVIYPEMVEDLNTPVYLNLLLSHLDVCKDVCDHFGITTALIPYKDKKKLQITGFTVKSFGAAKDSYDFEYDPFWDDGSTDDLEKLYEGIDEQEDGEELKDPYPKIENPVPDSDEKIIEISKGWVSTMMTDMGLCPFTNGADKAGLPMGPVHYEVDRASTVEDVYAKYWNEIVRVEVTPEKDLSTTLLILPEFLMENVEIFETFSTSLTQALAPLKVEDLVQLVFFHPHWVFRDGSARAGSERAANYARRSPWPMINLLRTNQVRQAQRGIPTGLVYQQNSKTLTKVGVDQLETMLRLRDWSNNTLKVDRKEYEALKLAQDFQRTGKLDPAELTIAADTAVAKKRVSQEGDLVKVFLQALEKRLGITDENSRITPLSGPETSAACMAGDVLLDALAEIQESGSESTPEAETEAKSTKKQTASKQTKSTKSQSASKEATVEQPKAPPSIEEDIVVKDDSVVPDEVQAARDARLAQARKAFVDDVKEAQQPPSRIDETTDAIFGKGGIPETDNDDDSPGRWQNMKPDSTL